VETLIEKASWGEANDYDTTLFQLIAEDIEKHGYSIRPAALPEEVSSSLKSHQLAMSENQFKYGGIGRKNDYLINEFVRTNEICWITGTSEAGRLWLQWTSSLRCYLNSRLFLGLFSFESHFAHYAPGDYYKRHYDAFKGHKNRVLSVVTYLNSGWTTSDGGELVLYLDNQDNEGIKIIPLLGTVVIFLSEEFPHEVLPAKRDRYSVAGWYHINPTHTHKADPPR
jgi:SM-20-related protein